MGWRKDVFVWLAQGSSWTYNAYANFGYSGGSSYSSSFSSWNNIQTALNVAGMVPGLGAPADIANAGISALRGDYTSASLSMAAVFVGGIANAANFANKVANGVSTGSSISVSTANSTSIYNNVIDSGISYGSSQSLRNAMTLGPGEQMHHIVEQTPSNIANFGTQAIQNTANVVPLSASDHIGSRSISAYYSSIQPFTGGVTVRNWLSTQSYDQQYLFGRDVLSSRGLIK